MSLDVFFNPKSIALVGATDRRNSVGLALVKNVFSTSKRRNIYLINPFRKRVLGKKTYPSILNVASSIDLVVIAVPSKLVPQIIDECIQKKVKGVIIISAGFAELGREGIRVQNDIAQKLKKARIPLIGPNCLGIISLSNKLNASFAPATPPRGNIAFISQSGAVIDSVIDSSLGESYGFSHIISCGNEAGLTLNDFLEFLENDRATKVIIIYVEEIKEGREFIKIAQRITKKKPIIVLKAGKTKAGQRAVQSHTGSLAGEEEVYSAAFLQSGVIEVSSLEEMFDLAKALAWQPRIKNNIAVITNGGGCGVLAVDYCEERGIHLSRIYQKTLKRIDQSHLMNPAYSRKNPLDIIGDALSSRYEVAIENILRQKDIEGLIVIQTFQLMTETEKDAKVIISAHKKFPFKAIVCAFLGGKMTQPGINLLEKHHIPNYSDVLRAVKAMDVLIKRNG